MNDNNNNVKNTSITPNVPVLVPTSPTLTDSSVETKLKYENFQPNLYDDFKLFNDDQFEFQKFKLADDYLNDELIMLVRFC